MLAKKNFHDEEQEKTLKSTNPYTKKNTLLCLKTLLQRRLLYRSLMTFSVNSETMLLTCRLIFLKHIAHDEGSKETLDDVLQFLNHHKDTLNSASLQSVVKTLASSYFSLNVLPLLQTLLAKSANPDVTYEVLNQLSRDPKNDTQRVIETIKSELPKLSPEKKKMY
ncbi:MAG: hypothetical protein BGO07_00100 [Alphaproteobacteria bacterium 40-19]|nr:MAG: hypothetical protein BGO07_00100 [Alphaproteobacteria bacterium 40-19]